MRLEFDIPYVRWVFVEHLNFEKSFSFEVTVMAGEPGLGPAETHAKGDWMSKSE